MYIKNQQFSDEDNLFEVLFDFELGDASGYMQELLNIVKTEVAADKKLEVAAAGMDEESRLELYDEAQREKTVKHLMAKFKLFKVQEAKFYGITDNVEELLYEIDMY